MNHNHPLTQFIIGTGTPFAGLFVSLSTHNAELQAASLVIGIFVGLATLINIVYKWFK